MDNIQEEFRDYIESGFSLVKTADESLSLMQEGLDEEMHSRSGAFSESVYIYYEPLREFIKGEVDDGFEVISVGLGLGYNEILSAIVAVKSNKNFEILSFEKEEVLSHLFKKRINAPSDYPIFYDLFIKKFGIDVVIKACNYLTRKCIFKKALNKASLKNIRVSSKAILFDAYSNKTSQPLWQPDFLEEFFLKCENKSFVTTYASTGNFNRALRKTGFIRDKKRLGFAKKRESTLAFKGVVKGV